MDHQFQADDVNQCNLDKRFATTRPYALRRQNSATGGSSSDRSLRYGLDVASLPAPSRKRPLLSRKKPNPFYNYEREEDSETSREFKEHHYQAQTYNDKTGYYENGYYYDEGYENQNGTYAQNYSYPESEITVAETAYDHNYEFSDNRIPDQNYGYNGQYNTYQTFHNDPENSVLPQHNSHNSTANVPDIFSFTRHNRYKDVESLLDRGVDVNIKDVHGNTILTIACQNGLKRIAKLALRRGADINIQNHNGNTALHYCYGLSYGETLGTYLISKGADPSLRNGRGMVCYEGFE